MNSTRKAKTMKREKKGYKVLTKAEFLKEVDDCIREDEEVTYFCIQRNLVARGKRVGYGVLEAVREKGQTDE
jgi:hypothetical protein